MKYKCLYTLRESWWDKVRWCREHFSDGQWCCTWSTIEFDREEDYTFFLLKWA